MRRNILDSKIPTDFEPQLLQDFSCRFSNVHSIEVVFRDHSRKLLEYIHGHDVLLGAVAWFTDLKIINALAGKGVAIVVQKEDFLRPDYAGSKEDLRRAYSKVGRNLDRWNLPGMAGALNTNGDPSFDPFRCVGNYNREKNPAHPRMHNKFLIGCEWSSVAEGAEEQDVVRYVKPLSVWTGSYNFTINAQHSFENAVIVRDPAVAEVYSQEWAQIFALSEPLDWSSDWVAPEYRIGT